MSQGFWGLFWEVQDCTCSTSGKIPSKIEEGTSDWTLSKLSWIFKTDLYSFLSTEKTFKDKSTSETGHVYLTLDLKLLQMSLCFLHHFSFGYPPDPKRLLRLPPFKQGKRGKYGMLRTLGSELDQKNKQKTTVAGGTGVICQEGHPKKERNKVFQASINEVWKCQC